MDAFGIASLALTVSSVLIGAGTFLLGFYLSERTGGTPSLDIRFLKYLVFSTILPSCVISGSIFYFVLGEPMDSSVVFVIMCAILSLIPEVAILIALAKTWS